MFIECAGTYHQRNVKCEKMSSYFVIQTISMDSSNYHKGAIKRQHSTLLLKEAFEESAQYHGTPAGINTKAKMPG